MWVIVSSLQFLSYMTLMNLNFPPNLLTFLDYIQQVHDFNRWMPNAFDLVLDKRHMDLTPYNSQYNSRGINTRNMLLLCGGDMEILVAIYICLFIVDEILPKHRWLTIIKHKLKYSTIIRSLIQSYLKYSIAAFINLTIVCQHY